LPHTGLVEHILHDIWAVIWGATWGNNMSAAEWSVVLGIGGWLGRDHIGKHLAAWWGKHYAPHAIAHHREALRQHEAARKGNDGPPSSG
jgi:hypothetical protein